MTTAVRDTPVIHWVSMSERTPRENQWVLIWNKKLDMSVLAKWTKNRWFANNCRPARANVKYWAEVTNPEHGENECQRSN